MGKRGDKRPETTTSSEYPKRPDEGEGTRAKKDMKGGVNGSGRQDQTRNPSLAGANRNDP